MRYGLGCRSSSARLKEPKRHAGTRWSFRRVCSCYYSLNMLSAALNHIIQSQIAILRIRFYLTQPGNEVSLSSHSLSNNVSPNTCKSNVPKHPIISNPSLDKQSMAQTYGCHGLARTWVLQARRYVIADCTASKYRAPSQAESKPCGNTKSHLQPSSASVRSVVLHWSTRDTFSYPKLCRK